jgi:hypothetical protein
VVAPAQHEIDEEWHKRSHQHGAEVVRRIAIHNGDCGPGLGLDAHFLDLRWLRRRRQSCPAPARFCGFLRLLLDFLLLLAKPLRDNRFHRAALDFVQFGAGFVHEFADTRRVSG